MKSLSTHIKEALGFDEGFSINEALKSVKLQELFAKSDKKLMKIMFTNCGLKWDSITDDDFSEVSPNEAKKLLNSDAFGIFLNSKGEFIGCASKGWVRVTPTYYKSGARRTSIHSMYKTVGAIVKDAASAYVFSNDIYQQLSSEYKAEKNSRWAQRADAVAFDSNESIKRDNLQRYQNIIQQNKISSNKDIDGKVKVIFQKYSEMFNDLVGSPDWIKIQEIGSQIKKLTDMYKDFLYISTQKHDIYDHQVRQLDATLASINKLYDDIIADNKEQTT